MIQDSIDEGKVQSTTRSQTMVRGLDIIDAVAEGPHNIAEIASITGLTYSTVHRIISVLVQKRYLKEEGVREFGLGPKLMELGFAAYSRIDLVQLARPWLDALSKETGDTVHLAQRDEWEVSYLDKLRGTRPVEISSRIGGRKPVISTGVGKALLLDEPEVVLKRIFQHDSHLLREKTTEADWLKLMATYRNGGFAYDMGEDSPAIRCVAVPVRDAGGRIIAAISVSSMTVYMSPERMRELIIGIQRVAGGISNELGARIK